MDPKFQSSFIPKKSMASSARGASAYKHSSFNLIPFVAIVIFVIAVLGSGAAFTYEYILQDKVNLKGSQLAEGSDVLSMSQVNEFKALDKRLNAAWQILREHKAPSLFFRVLEESTLHNVSFNSYSFSTGEGLNTVILSGQAANFNALSLQASVFEQQEEVLSADYNNFLPTEDGRIGFDMTIIIDPNSLNYLSE